MAATKLTTVFVCLCLIQGSSGFLAAFFGPNSIFGRGGFPFGPQMGFSQTPSDGAPSICQKRTCVAYTTVSKTPDYEHRRYENMSVAYTSQMSRGFIGNIGLSSRLSGYVTGGKNKDNLVMNKTYPILTPLTNVSTMIFILPMDNPPAPTNPKVTLDRMPAMEVYVKPFNEFAMSKEAAVDSFKNSLAAAGVVTTDDAYFADYHNTFSMFNRRSELWVVGKYLVRGEEPAVPVQQRPQHQTGPQTGIQRSTAIENNIAA